MDLSTEIAGIRLKNPCMNASGVLSSTPETLKKLEEYNFAAVVTKSTTREGRSGNAGPTIIGLAPSIMLNRMGLPNPGVDYFVEDLNKYKFKIPIIGSATGSSIEEFVYVSKTLESAPAVELIEINAGCPNTDNDIICFEKEFLEGLLKELDRELSKPYSVKLSPFTNFKELRNTIEIINKSKAKALVLTNTIPVRIEPAPELELVYNWGQSGKSILGLSLRNVYEASQCTKLDIIGCGGVSGPKDVISYIHNGAKAVQLGTVLQHGMAESIMLIMEKGISEYMKEEGYKSLEDFRGIY